MLAIVMKALQDEEETILDDALVEFNEMAEIEPKFFRKNFKDIF